MTARRAKREPYLPFGPSRVVAVADPTVGCDESGHIPAWMIRATIESGGMSGYTRWYETCVPVDRFLMVVIDIPDQCKMIEVGRHDGNEWKGHIVVPSPVYIVEPGRESGDMMWYSRDAHILRHFFDWSNPRPQRLLSVE